MLKSLVTLSIVFLCNVVLALGGLGLGVASLIRSRRMHQDRLLPLLGISLNGLVLLAFGAMMAGIRSDQSPWTADRLTRVPEPRGCSGDL